MTESPSDFLNNLLLAQPEIARLLDQGIVANDRIKAMPEISTRMVGGTELVTITGIIYALTKQMGCPCASIYSEGDRLVAFACPQGPIAYPQEQP